MPRRVWTSMICWERGVAAHTSLIVRSSFLQEQLPARMDFTFLMDQTARRSSRRIHRSLRTSHWSDFEDIHRRSAILPQERDAPQTVSRSSAASSLKTRLPTRPTTHCRRLWISALLTVYSLRWLTHSASL